MIFPLSILTAALAAAAVTAYGCDPRWMVYPHGLQIITLSRQLQGPLLALALSASVLAICMVASGGWRVWWLIGLTPVLALFAHRFATDPGRAWQVNPDASFVRADQAPFIHDADYVVGLTFDGDAYAYPFSVLYQNPIVAQARPRRRLVLFWSPFANRALAVQTDWTLKPRDLEIVSMPANALLVYNTELGQFINGVTGLTPQGTLPTGFVSGVPIVKTTFATWRRLHPQTFVLCPPAGWTGGPTLPVAPLYPMPQGRLADTTQVALIDADQPLAIRDTSVTAAPLNLLIKSDPVLLIRDADGQVRAFLRQANGDLTPRFYPIAATTHSSAVLAELDSNSSWAVDGRAVDGPLKGEKLRPFEVDDGVYLDVASFWFPKLTTIVPTPQDVGQAPRRIIPQRRQIRRSARRRSVTEATGTQAITPSVIPAS